MSAKHADYAGTWYDASPSSLRSELQGYLDAVGAIKLNGEAVGFLVPHAGIGVSGSVAAYSYKAAALQDPKTIVVVGFTHKYRFSGISVFTDKSFVTPLGEAYTDQVLSAKFIAYNGMIKDVPEAFNSENSIEMQIPFIQYTMPEAKVVLIAMGEQDTETISLLADALYNILVNEDSFVIMGSTDMSHYLRYDEANRVDERTIKMIRKFDPESLYSMSIRNNHQLFCGIGSTCATMMACSKLGANVVEVMKYANSGDTIGKRDSVVGYLSAVFIKRQENTMLNEKQRKVLLKIARDTIDLYLRKGERLDVKVDDDLLKQDMGAFVTLHKRGNLRGCIGHMEARAPLYLTIRDMAIAASTQDPRFPTVRLDEMDAIDIEISVLSPMQLIDDYNLIEAGRHGVMVKRGLSSGVYLPQVAIETGWNRDQFMNSLCAQKAGIPEDAWKTGDCEISIFTAEVFGERNE